MHDLIIYAVCDNKDTLPYLHQDDKKQTLKKWVKINGEKNSCSFMIVGQLHTFGYFFFLVCFVVVNIHLTHSIEWQYNPFVFILYHLVVFFFCFGPAVVRMWVWCVYICGVYHVRCIFCGIWNLTKIMCSRIVHLSFVFVLLLFFSENILCGVKFWSQLAALFLIGCVPHYNFGFVHIFFCYSEEKHRIILCERNVDNIPGYAIHGIRCFGSLYHFISLSFFFSRSLHFSNGFIFLAQKI